MTPIEVWLTQKNMSVRCMVIHEDESYSLLRVNSLNMRGAQREMTAKFSGLDYSPVGRWKLEANRGGIETSRQFRKKEG